MSALKLLAILFLALPGFAISTPAAAEDPCTGEGCPPPCDPEAEPCPPPCGTEPCPPPCDVEPCPPECKPPEVCPPPCEGENCPPPCMEMTDDCLQDCLEDPDCTPPPTWPCIGGDPLPPTVTGGAHEATGYRITWQDPLNTLFDVPVVGYRIYRFLEGDLGTPGVKLPNELIGATLDDTLTFLDTAYDSAKVYGYAVTAVVCAGGAFAEGLMSNLWPVALGNCIEHDVNAMEEPPVQYVEVGTGCLYDNPLGPMEFPHCEMADVYVPVPGMPGPFVSLECVILTGEAVMKAIPVTVG